MDYIQILFNVLILCGLAWFVFRENFIKYADHSDVVALRGAIDCVRKDYNNMSLRLSREKQFKAKESFYKNCYAKMPKEEKTDAERMILLGAELTDKAYQAGSKIVLESLAREGRIAHEPRYVHEEKAFNLDEFDVDETLKDEMAKEEKEGGLPPIIAQMNERMGREFAAAGLKERERDNG